MADVWCQVLITLLAGKDRTEAQRSVLSPHNKRRAEFGSGPLRCEVLSVLLCGVLLRSEQYSGFPTEIIKKNRSSLVIALDHDFGFRNTVGAQVKTCVVRSKDGLNWNKTFIS